MLPIFPSLVIDNPVGVRIGNSKFLGYIHRCYSSRGEFVSHCRNCFWLNFAGWIVSSAHVFSFAWNMASSLGKHVSVVFNNRSKPQMFWIYTPLIITTGAIVENIHSFWNRSIAKNPRSPMSKDAVYFEFGLYDSISLVICRCCPNPTRVRFVDLFPKSFRETWGHSLRGKIFVGKLWLHIQSMVDVPRSRLLPVVRGHFFILAQRGSYA